MSDAGTYFALQGDAVAALAGIPGVATVAATLSVADLVLRDGIAKPAIGVILAGTRLTEAYAIGQRSALCRTTWEIPVALNDLRGGASARPQAYRILEEIRDRLHGAASSKSSSRWEFVSETWPEQQPEGLLVAVATFGLDVYLGN